MSSPDNKCGSDAAESSRCDEEELASGTIGTGATTDDDPSVGAETDYNAEVEKTTLARRDEGGRAISLVERKRRKYRFLDGRSIEGTSVSSGSAISGVSVISDMCRICHMGNPPSLVTLNRGRRRRSSCRETPVDSQSILSLGLLVSACKCRGTVGLIHTKCLERWLTESGHTRCEICGYHYATIRVPRHGIFRSLLLWLKSFVGSRQMLMDSLCFVVTTPLAIFSAYVCSLTLKLALENRFNDVPWMVVAMLPTCMLTLVAYWGWLLTIRRPPGQKCHFPLATREGIVTSGRRRPEKQYTTLESKIKNPPDHMYTTLGFASGVIHVIWDISYFTSLVVLHGRRWRQYWQNNFVIRLIPDIPVSEEANTQTSDITSPSEEELYENFHQLFEVL